MRRCRRRGYFPEIFTQKKVHAHGKSPGSAEAQGLMTTASRSRSRRGRDSYRYHEKTESRESRSTSLK